MGRKSRDKPERLAEMGRLDTDGLIQRFLPVMMDEARPYRDEPRDDRIEDRFHIKHEELYTYASRGQEVVFVNARVAAVGEVARLDEGVREAAASGTCSPRGKRQAFFGGWREVPVYALDDLRPGHSLSGPAIIEAETTTVLVDIGDRVTVNELGWLYIHLR